MLQVQYITEICAARRSARAWACLVQSESWSTLELVWYVIPTESGSVLNTCSRRGFSLLRALSPVTIRGITADIEHASRCGVNLAVVDNGSRDWDWSRSHICARSGYRFWKLRRDNVAMSPARDFSEESISRLGLLELPWDWTSTCVHLLYRPMWLYQREVLLRRILYAISITLRYILVLGFWYQVTFGIDILPLKINRHWILCE